MSIKASISNANTDIKATVNTRSQIIPGSVNILAGAGTVVGAEFNSPVIISGTLKGKTEFRDTPSFHEGISIPLIKRPAGTAMRDRLAIELGAGSPNATRLNHIIKASSTQGGAATIGQGIKIQGGNQTSGSTHHAGPVYIDGGSPQALEALNASAGTVYIGTERAYQVIVGSKTMNGPGSPSAKFIVNAPSSEFNRYVKFSDTPSLPGLKLEDDSPVIKVDSEGKITFENTGGVVFNRGSGATNNVQIGQNALYYDAGQDVIGIGRTNPAYALDVLGDARFSGPNILLNCGILDADTSLTHRIDGGIVSEHNTPTFPGIKSGSTKKDLKINTSAGGNVSIGASAGPLGGGKVNVTQIEKLSGDLGDLNFGSDAGARLTIGSQNARALDIQSTGSFGTTLFKVDAATNKIISNGVTELNGADTKIQSVGVFLTNIPTFDSEAAAASGGLDTDRVYKTSTGELRIKL